MIIRPKQDHAQRRFRPKNPGFFFTSTTAMASGLIAKMQVSDSELGVGTVFDALRLPRP
jgi:hypothetical protein